MLVLLIGKEITQSIAVDTKVEFNDKHTLVNVIHSYQQIIQAYEVF